jgi:ABC-type transport system involved in multi-copper enzyme maturation permease subunit
VAGLEIELAKLLASRDFRVSAAIYALLRAVAVLSLKAFAFEAPGAVGGYNLLAFPDIWHNATYVGGWVDYLLYVVALQVVTSEYQFHTARQHVIDGMSRLAFARGKILLLALFAGTSTTLVASTALALGMWAGGSLPGASLLSGLGFVPLHALQAFGYLMLALLIGTAVRRTGSAALVFLGYTLLAEPLLRTLALPHWAARYLPSAVFADLVPNPFFGYAGMRVTTAFTHTVVFGALYAGVFAAAAAWLFSRQDL